MHLLHYIHIRENSMLARIAAKKLGVSQVALTIGKTIHLCRTPKAEFLANERWVKHELVHVEQFRKYGFLRFIGMYLWESARNGYYNNRFEIEARAKESA
ncbi:MAG: eCIS core domain-containing protein [Chitinophagaceae bacterium]